MDLPFHTLDVFTTDTFGGNPLGVFPDATHLPTTSMQRIAREMNLSETVFLGPPETEGGSMRVRIFTPGSELPFAGHPTVGAAIFAVLSGYPALREGWMDERPAPGAASLVLEENVGPVPVDVRVAEDGSAFATLSTAILSEHRASPLDRDALAAVVGLEPGDLDCESDFPGMRPEMVSCGTPFFVIPVRRLEAIRRAALDTAAWKRDVALLWASKVYLVCPEAEGAGVDFHVRMFAPGLGVPEDPATGSAAACLGGYLAAVDGRSEGTISWLVEQGLEMGRPSLLHVEADRARGATTAIRVGGSAVVVSRGVMRIPTAQDSPEGRSTR